MSESKDGVHPAARPATIRTGGGLVWRVKAGALQVQLVHRPRYDDWSWPKGKVDPGEGLRSTAVREIAEETGKPVVLGIPLPGTRYMLADGQRKTVAYWAARRIKTKGDLRAEAARPPREPVDPSEIDHVLWLSANEAKQRLTRRADRGPLTVLVEAYDAGLLDTRALVIARHGTAIPRAGWHGTEPLRPLTPLGHGHAHALVPVLSAYGVSRVVSSEWERCAATVAPYAAAAGLTTWCSEHLSEAKHEKKPARVAATVQDLLASRRSSVLCTHRPVLPTVLDVLSEHADASVTALLPTIDPYLLPGELLVAHVARPADSPRIVAIEHVIPPLT